MIYRKVAIGLLLLFASSIALGFVHPWGELRAAAAEGEILGGSAAPPEVRHIVEAKCADCHSNRTHWPVYSRLAPGSWLMERDVQGGRTALDLSRWSFMNSDERIAALTRVAAELRSGDMPPRAYTFVHPGNRLSADERQIVIAWARTERKSLRVSSDSQSRKDKP